MSDELLQKVSSAVVIKPGDRVLLVLNERWSDRELADAGAALQAAFPEATFVYVDGVDSVLVARADSA